MQRIFAPVFRFVLRFDAWRGFKYDNVSIDDFSLTRECFAKGSLSVAFRDMKSYLYSFLSIYAFRYMLNFLKYPKFRRLV